MDTNIKLFICETCCKTFVRSVDLHRHKKMTTTHDFVKHNEYNEIVYECEVCRHEFKNPQVLLAHRRRHDFEHEKTVHDSSQSLIMTTTLAF